MHPPLQDFPDCNHVHYPLQLNLYARMLRDKYGIRVTELILGVFHPNQGEDPAAETYIPPPHYRRGDLPLWDMDPIVALELEGARSYPREGLEFPVEIGGPRGPPDAGPPSHVLLGGGDPRGGDAVEDAAQRRAQGNHVEILRIETQGRGSMHDHLLTPRS